MSTAINYDHHFSQLLINLNSLVITSFSNCSFICTNTPLLVLYCNSRQEKRDPVDDLVTDIGEFAICHVLYAMATWIPFKIHLTVTIVRLPSTREYLFGLNAPGHCLVRVCLLHCMRMQSRNGYARGYSQIMQHTHTHKAVIVEDNRTIIHTPQHNFLFSGWLLIEYAEYIEMSTALRVLRPDCARCFWYVISLVLMLVQCTHLRFVQWTTINISLRALDLNNFSRYKTYTFVDL